MGQEKVLLTSVSSLTLYAGKQTRARRTSSIPQLRCVKGNACKYVNDSEDDDSHISVMQCRNQGSDGSDVQWECRVADLSDWFRLGETTVSCEGYSYPDDPYVLAGSCGVEYTLHLTAKGKQHFKQTSNSWFGSTRSSSSSYWRKESSWRNSWGGGTVYASGINYVRDS